MTNDELLAVLRDALAERNRDLAAAQHARDRVESAIFALELSAGKPIMPRPLGDLPPSATPKPVGRANGATQPAPPVPTRRTGRRLKLSDDTLAQIAAIANQAICECRDPGKAIAERFSIRTSSASVYMIEARNAGHDIPHMRACAHCGRTFHLRGVATHERTCLSRALPVSDSPSRPPGRPVPPSSSTTDGVLPERHSPDRHAATDETEPVAPSAKGASRRLADEIAELRARDRAEHDAKGRSAITDSGGGDDQPARVWWTCGDCSERFDRKMELHRHLADVHDRHHLHAHEEVGAIA